MGNKDKKKIKELEKENSSLKDEILGIKKELQTEREEHQRSKFRSIERIDQLKYIIYGDPDCGPNPNHDSPTISRPGNDWDANGISY